MSIGIELAERGYLPDWLIRFGIRQQLGARLMLERKLGCEGLSQFEREFRVEQRKSAIAIHTREANEQHYELPSPYFEMVLGPHRKYSSCLWPPGVEDLSAAEDRMLALTCDRAQIVDGMDIMDLGCGWGSMSLWMATHYPSSQIYAVSNSASQREFIERQATERRLDNLKVETCDINQFTPPRKFDRIVSVEMFEHLRNYEQLFERIAQWLSPVGKLFAHVFYHGRCGYPFETDGKNDWMARHFFTGGMMPSADMMLFFQRDLLIEDRWLINGAHYEKTLNAWLARHDAARDKILPLFEATYGRELAKRMFYRWRIFYLACAELFGFRDGEEWGVAHFLFCKREST